VKPEEYIAESFEESIRLKRAVLDRQSGAILAMARRMADCLRGGGKILFCGNGGSAADSQHLATELVVRLSPRTERRALAALALSTDSSLLTACANDFGFERTFARQVEALGAAEDCLVTISTSGNSLNVVEAARRARERGMAVLGLLGGTGGSLRELADQAVTVPSADPGRVQECHITVGHVLVGLVERELDLSDAVS